MIPKLKLSSLFEKNLNVLLLTFFNINSNGKDFYIQGSFKKSKYSNTTYNKEILFSDVADRLTIFYDLPFYSTGTQYRCDIDNDMDYTFSDLVHKLRTLIILKIAQISDVDILDNKIALAITILRGSPDFKRHLVAVDIKRANETEEYLEALFRILSSSNNLLKYLNWNFRDLQKQFVEKERTRYTQLRINLRWVFENILNDFKVINPYKYQLISGNSEECGNLPKTNKMYETFIERLSFYRERIVDKKLSESEIKLLRNDLFDEKNKVPQRSRQIVLFIKNSTEDICSACKDKFDISNRTFKMSKDNRYYFEYHHVISFANDRYQLDVPDNLVKLCPACHSAMTPRRAEEDYQKILIRNILINRSDVLDFTRAFLKSEKLSDLVDGVYERLA